MGHDSSLSQIVVLQKGADQTDSHGWYSIQLDNQAKLYFNGLGVPDAFQDLLFTSSALQNGTHNLVLTNEPMYNSTAEYYKCESIGTLNMLAEPIG